MSDAEHGQHPLHVMVVADQYYPPTLGGSAISARRLAAGLASRGHRVTVLAPSTGFQDYVEFDQGTTVLRRRSLPALHLWKHTDRHQIRAALFPDSFVTRAIRVLSPQIVHIQVPALMGAAAVRVARELDIPVVATLHALPENVVPTRDKGSLLFRAVSALFWEEVISFCDRCDVVTAPSHTACRLLEEHGLRRRAIPTSNGVDTTIFRPPRDPAEKLGARRRLGLPLDPPLVLYAGRLAAEKRLDVLVEAMARVLQERRAHLVLAGSGSTEIEQLAHALGIGHAVTFTGRIDDDLFPLVYRAADIFALPSEAELQGIVLLEAAASGLPLVGARVYAIPEIVQHGVNGLLHQPGDADDLAQCLGYLIDHSAVRQHMGERGRALAAQHSLPNLLVQWERLYRQALEAREALAAVR